MVPSERGHEMMYPHCANRNVLPFTVGEAVTLKKPRVRLFETRGSVNIRFSVGGGVVSGKVDACVCVTSDEVTT